MIKFYKLKILFVLIIIFIISISLNFLESRKKISKLEYLNTIKIDKNKNTNKNSVKYYDVFKTIESNKNITINKMNKIDNKNLLKFNMEFKGDKKELNNFINILEKQNNFKDINSIYINKINNEYLVDLDIDFMI